MVENMDKYTMIYEIVFILSYGKIYNVKSIMYKQIKNTI